MSETAAVKVGHNVASRRLSHSYATASATQQHRTFPGYLINGTSKTLITMARIPFLLLLLAVFATVVSAGKLAHSLCAVPS